MYVKLAAAAAMACAALSHTNLGHTQTSAPSAVDLQLWQQPKSPAPRRVHWYGYQLLGVDAAAVAFFLVGLPNGVIDGGNKAVPTTEATTGALLYAAGGPVIHALHHRPKIAALSLIVRIGAPRKP